MTEFIKIGGGSYEMVPHPFKLEKLTDRFDLAAEQIAQVYKLRWDIEPSSVGGSGTSRFTISFQEAAMVS